MNWIFYLLLTVVLMVGLFINLVGLPGLWVMVMAAMAYAWGTGWMFVGWKTLVILVVLGVIAEVVELLAGSAGAKAAGGSKRGMVGAVIGALAGGLVGSVLVPVVGTIIGAIAGAFIGGAVVEVMIGRPIQHSLKVGIGAAKGRFWGIVSKSAIGLVMLITTLVVAFPWRARANAPAITIPASPATTRSSTQTS